MSYKTRRDEDDGLGQIIPLCREHTLSRVNPQSRAFAAIPGGTIVGPDIEVQIVEILDQYGHEIAIPSPNDSTRTTHVTISRGRSRFVDEVHIPIAELRSSAELLTELQEENLAWDRRRLASRRLVRAMFQVRLASRRFVRTPLAFLPAKRLFSRTTIPTTERKWKVIPANSSHGGALSMALQHVYKNGVSLRPR